MRWIIPILVICTYSISASIGIKRQAPEVRGRVCAFADFNADRNTDLLISRDGNLTILLQETKLLDVVEGPKYINISTWNIADKEPRENLECSVGDFNGDARLDVLVSIRLGEKAYNHTLWISQGNYEFLPTYIGILYQHALSVDVSTNGIIDILGFHPNGSLFCAKVQQSGKVNPLVDDCTGEFKHFPEKTNIYDGMPHLLVDVNNDLRSDLVFMTKDDDGSLVMSVWQKQKIGFVFKDWITKLSSAQYSYIAAPVTMDFDADGQMDILVPICREAECRHVTSLAVFSYKHGWTTAAIDLQDLEVQSEPYSRVLFRVGDFSLDGYPDMVALLVNKQAKNVAAGKVIENLECKNCEKNGTRKFEIKKLELIQPRNMALGRQTMASFFDLYEDGSLDMLVEYEYAGEIRTGFIDCPDKGDTTFLKVQVFTGICEGSCDKPKGVDTVPGVSMPGACISYSRIDGWGGNAQSITCQVPSTTYRSLFPPYALFGLGRSPNFVDELNIGIPRYVDRKDSWKHTLKQIVPNSRIIVVPPGLEQGGPWISRLYVTPSTLIVQSCMVIASVCAMLLLVVAFLHYREKKEDRYERQQQSHRFHFDAM